MMKCRGREEEGMIKRRGMGRNVVDAITFWLLDAGGGGGGRVLTCSDYTCSVGVNQLMIYSAVGGGGGEGASASETEGYGTIRAKNVLLVLTTT
jgi:hypothetical protein